MATVILNGESKDIPEGLSVASLLAHLGVETDRVAVERNELIVKRPNWDSVKIASGDRLEVVTFVGGGCDSAESESYSESESGSWL